MYAYDVALSFAGEDRQYVERVANTLKAMRIRVFYDKYETATLWGKNLYTHLQDVYCNRARFTVIFISAHYKEKLWANHERESAQAKAFTEKAEYILPARFDHTKIPGVLPTTGYIDLHAYSPEEFAAIIKEKLESAGSQSSSSQTAAKPVSSRNGVAFLAMQAYSQAQQAFEEAIATYPDDAECNYYLALSSLKGRCPRELQESLVKKVESHLQLATRLDGKQAHYYYFWAFVKYDFYTINGMLIHPPSYDELLAKANTLTCEKEKITEFLKHVPNGAERKNPLLKQLMSL